MERADTSGTVRCVKMSSAAYAALDVKDPDTLYFVSETGIFDPTAIESEGDIYLGDKMLTNGAGGAAFNPANPMSNRQGVFYVRNAGTSSAWTATLSGLTAYYVGLRIAVFTTVEGGTSLTFNVNGLGAVPVRRYGGTNPKATPVESIVTLTYARLETDTYVWVMDSYADTTYTLSNSYLNFGGTVTGTYGIKRKSLCAFTADGKLSSLTQEAGTGSKVPVDVDFAIGRPLYLRTTDTNVNAGITLTTGYYFYYSYSGFDLRYSGTGLTESNTGTGHDIYVEVSVNPQAGTWRPTQRLLVTDTQIQAGNYYILVGRQRDEADWKQCNLNTDNPLFACINVGGAPKLVPYCYKPTYRDSKSGANGSTFPIEFTSIGQFHPALTGINASGVYKAWADLTLSNDSAVDAEAVVRLYAGYGSGNNINEPNNHTPVAATHVHIPSGKKTHVHLERVFAVATEESGKYVMYALLLKAETYSVTLKAEKTIDDISASCYGVCRIGDYV